VSRLEDPLCFFRAVLGPGAILFLESFYQVLCGFLLKALLVLVLPSLLCHQG